MHKIRIIVIEVIVIIVIIQYPHRLFDGGFLSYSSMLMSETGRLKICIYHLQFQFNTLLASSLYLILFSKTLLFPLQAFL